MRGLAAPVFQPRILYLKKFLKYLCIWDVAALLVCAVFVLIKIPYLDLPYFWDEAWVYAPAVFDMYENGPSLSPNSINPELSRGHPILFHFLAVCWMTIFGTSFIAVHSFTVFISVLLIGAVYQLGTQLANRKVGFWSAAFFSLQPIFISQAGFLLPEVLLSLFVVLSILFYIKRKVWLFILFGTAMLLTKETGVLVIGIIGLLELSQFINDKDFTKNRIVELLSIGTPLMFIGVYFLVQYKQFGWFMFPEHMSMFETDPMIWRDKRKVVYNVVFANQQRPLFIGIALAALSMGWRNGPSVLRALFGIIGLTFLTTTSTSSWLPHWYFYWVFPFIIIIASIWVAQFFQTENTKNQLFIPMVGLICLAMILFTSAHFVIGRYLLLVIPLVIISSLILTHLALKKSGWLFNTAMICLALMLYHYANKADARLNPFDNMRYVNEVQVIQEGVAYLEQNVDLDKCISATFIVQQALQNPVQGYRNTDKLPSCIDNKIAPNVDYVLTLSFNNDNGKLEAIETHPEYEMIWETKKGRQYAKIYQRK